MGRECPTPGLTGAGNARPARDFRISGTVGRLRKAGVKLWVMKNENPYLNPEVTRTLVVEESPNAPGYAYQREKEEGGDGSADDSQEEIPQTPADDPAKGQPPEPTYSPDVSHSVATLMSQLTRLFQKQDLQRDKKQEQKIDRKQCREIDEKKQAMGIRG